MDWLQAGVLWVTLSHPGSPANQWFAAHVIELLLSLKELTAVILDGLSHALKFNLTASSAVPCFRILRVGVDHLD